MSWQFNNREAVFLQIASRLRMDILGGIYASGDQLPTVRQLAYDAGVNPNTVQKALTYLEEEGILSSRGTVGRFVTSDEAVLLAARERVRREAVAGWLAEARAMGMTAEDLIGYIKKEEECQNDNTGIDL